MKRKTLIMSILAMLGAQALSAQDYTDLLRYSQKFYQSDARSMGVGNAMGAIGADPISMSINPAGMGLYRKNEFSFGLGFAHPQASSTYLGNVSTDDKYNLNVGSIGLVISDLKYDETTPRKDGWVAVNYGIAFNRTNSFNSNVSIEGQNNKNSILDAASQNAKGTSPASLDPFSLANLAYQSKLINTNGDSSSYRPVQPGRTTYQRDEISTKGAMNDIALSIAANYSNKIFLGGTLSIPTITYHYSRIYAEQHKNQSDSIQSLEVDDIVNTSGVGITATFGVIVKPVEFLRLGVSAQLPSFYSMNDDYSKALTSSVTFSGTNPYTVSSPQGNFDYSIVTPFRYTLSAALIAGKSGFISADYEYVDYTSARVNSTFTGSYLINKDVQYYLQGGNNFRLGGEYRFDVWALRAGYNYYSSPYKSQFVPSTADESSQVLSFGAGYRSGNFFADVAYQLYTKTYFYSPYYIVNSPSDGSGGSIVKDKRTNILATVGWRF
jgi:hypothetical protein